MRFFEVCGTIPSSVLACMPLVAHLLSKAKNHLPRANGPSLLKMVMMNSGYIVVDPLDDSLIGKAEKPFVFHIDDQMLMYLDADDVCRLDDFPRNLQIIGGRRKVI